MRRRINPHHLPQRTGLRLLGWLLALTGGAFAATGLIDFFAAFGGHGQPTLFWCLFVGVPMLGFGMMLLKLGYMASIARYVAGETVPVATDAANELAHGTRRGVKAFVGAVRDGLMQDAGTAVACGSCGADNDTDATFCDQCGQPIARELRCPSCAEPVDRDARFCDQCGQRLGAAG